MSGASDLRLARVEKEVSELYDTIENLKNTVSQLNITIALLQQTIQSLKTEADSRAAFNQRVSFFLVGGVVSAVLTFVIKGGLAI